MSEINLLLKDLTTLEYGDLLRKSPYSVRMRENIDQKNSEYGHFSRCELHLLISKILKDTHHNSIYFTSYGYFIIW